ncbi:MAG TPA: hypothetical protein VHP55_11945, partial [Usitatibacter sp.]|nr:hypothetical protein [Usitatibacter sp.]
MDLRIAVPESSIAADVLDAGLEALTRLDERLLKEGSAPTFHQALQAGRVRWKPEPPGAERFDHAKKVLQRGWGDCDDLAPWRAASLRATGEDRGAEARVYKSGPGRWHAIVQRSDGRLEDPSLEAGMRKHSGIVGVAPAVCGPMFMPGTRGVNGTAANRPSIAMRPRVDRWGNRGWEARTDLPWTETDYAMAALARAPVASQALIGCIEGVCAVGDVCGIADDEDLAKLHAVGWLCSGVHPQDVVDEVGEDIVLGVLPLVGAIAPQVGFDFFKDIIKPIAPIASKVVSFVPGVGPIASTAIDVATSLIPDNKGAPPPPGPPPQNAVPLKSAATVYAAPPRAPAPAPAQAPRVT